MPYISVNNLGKSYKVLKKNAQRSFRKEYTYISAIKNVSFDVEQKDILGYIGPNGAGKSTTIKVLSGILKPDSGTCIVDGMVPWEDRKAYVKKIGVMFGQRSQLLWDLTPRDSFELLRGIYKVDSNDYKESIAALVDMLDIGELLDKNVRQMSLGQRIRCELAATFIHDPSIVFLDEPTIGLDIETKRKFHSFIMEINKYRNVTLFITTHDLDDIQSLCNRLIIINDGEVFFNDRMEKIFEYDIPAFIEVELVDLEDEFVLPDSTLRDDVTAVERCGTKVKLQINSNKNSGIIMRQIMNANHVFSINSEKPRIDDIIHKIYQTF